MIIHNNIPSLRANNNLKRIGKQKKKAIENLSSGYRINKAGDNAAGLSISEGMRAQIRGLERAIRNAEEGISYVQVVDGAMEQVSNILQRIRELSIQSLNDTNTQEDRFQIQKEIEQLRKEIDGLNRRTEFNSRKVFDQYKGTYYSYNGGHAWEVSEIHSIDSSNDSLNIMYTMKKGGAQRQLTVTLEHGDYTTEALFEEIDRALEAADPSISFEMRYNTDKTCAIEMRDGYRIEQVSGGLSYLFSGGYNGAETSFLVGTTVFYPGYPLTIVEGRNDTLSFDIENYDDTVEHIDIKIKPGKYTRKEMIDLLNSHLEGTGMTASNYGDYSIQVGGNNGMISGLKGNMFQIDDQGSIVVSVFYDNIRYGTAQEVPATMKGGAVLCKSDPAHNKYHIDENNNKLYVKTGISREDYQEIILNTGTYTAEQMAQHLQAKMNSLGVTVSSFSEPYLTPNGKNEICYGLKIVTNAKGEAASLAFDTVRSTAYRTLFVERAYDDQNINQDLDFIITNDQDYRTPLYSTVSGYASFSAGSGPYKIGSSNHSFKVQIKELLPDISEGLLSKESEAVITLAEKSYNDINEIVSEINRQIKADPVLAGKIEAFRGSVDGVSDVIQLRNANRDVCGIQVSSDGSDGYKTLFIGEKVVTETKYYYSDFSKEPKLTTLPKDFFNNVTEEEIENDQIKIDSSNNTFMVRANGYPQQQIVLDQGTYTRKQLEEEITKKLNETRTERIHTFAKTGYGGGPSTSFCSGHNGSESTTLVSCDVQGQGKKQDGSTFVENGKPAEFLMNMVSLPDTIKIDAGNDLFELEISGVPCEIKLNHATYSKQQLADALDTALLGRVNVTLDGGCLKFTTVEVGEGATLAFGNQGSLKNSSFLDGLCTKREPAVRTMALQDNIKVTASENTFKFSFNGTNVSVTLPLKEYSRSDFVKELNKQLEIKGIGVTAELVSGTQLRLTTKETGSNMTLAVKPDDSGSLSEAMFGKRTEASVTIPQKPLDSITIPENNNQFKIRIRGADGVYKIHTAELQKGKTYTKEELVRELNQKFSSVAMVSLDSNGLLVFKTKEKGSNVRIDVQGDDYNVDYNNDLTLVKAIFGYTKAPELTASFSNSAPNKNCLEISGSKEESAYRIEVWNNKETHTEMTNPKVQETARSVSFYSLKTRNALASQIAITEENKDLSFDYYMMENGYTTRKKVQISLEERVYTREELQKALEEGIAADLGAGEIGVSIDETGILFQALKCGPGNDKIHSGGYNNNHYIVESSLSGGFFHYIIEGNIARKEYLTPSLEQGGIKLSDTYIIGRRDVKNTITHIMEGETDQLKIDITFEKKEDKQRSGSEAKVFTLNMVLQDGEYSCGELIEHIQSKLDEAVLEAGLPAHSVLVDVGRFDSHVAGANDQNALQFYLNPDLKWEEGDYRIDGIAGNSLPAVFYSTTGDPIPAYIVGTKDISSGVKITPGNNEFSINVDGTVYVYTIPEGEYSQEEFLKKMNEVFAGKDRYGNTALIKAGSQNGHFKVSYRGQGVHYLSSVQGSSRSEVFFRDTMIEQHSSLRLQVGANSGQELEIQRTSIGSFRLGIDTVSVETRTLAKKALKHVDKAMKYVSGERAIYGAYQNRLEHIVEANSIAGENLQDAESRIRDTDIAEEMVSYAKHSILEQAGISMLVNANSLPEDVLRLMMA